MSGPPVERDAPMMSSSHRFVLRCAVLALLIAAGVAFLLPGSGADGAAWALLVLALASIAAFAATSEPIEVPRRHVERHNSRDGARTRLDETDRAHRDRG
jgi:hypothetical protein